MDYSKHSLFEAIIVLIFKGPFLILGWFFKHKALLVMAIVAIIALVAINTFRSHTALKQVAVAIPAYQTLAPDKTLAPTIVQTSSRVYYVADFTDDGKIITLKSFYTFDKKKWELVNTPLQLDRSVYGRIEIYRR